ncbi:MAG: DUF5063 domain-containing protein [Bacteroidales bacterium]
MTTQQDAPEDKTISRPILEMITVANEYCLFFENIENHQPNDILIYFQRIAPLLYLKGALIPAVDIEDESESERYVTEEQWEQIFKTLRDKFQDQDTYYIHNVSFDSEEASLSENMADIFQDMKDFVMLYQKNTLPARQNAINLLRQLYRWRWGPGAINALGAVHNILYKDDVDPGLFQSDEEWL